MGNGGMVVIPCCPPDKEIRDLFCLHVPCDGNPRHSHTWRSRKRGKKVRSRCSRKGWARSPGMEQAAHACYVLFLLDGTPRKAPSFHLGPFHRHHPRIEVCSLQKKISRIATTYSSLAPLLKISGRGSLRQCIFACLLPSQPLKSGSDLLLHPLLKTSLESMLSCMVNIFLLWKLRSSAIFHDIRPSLKKAIQLLKEEPKISLDILQQPHSSQILKKMKEVFYTV